MASEGAVRVLGRELAATLASYERIRDGAETFQLHRGLGLRNLGRHMDDETGGFEELPNSVLEAIQRRLVDHHQRQ